MRRLIMVTIGFAFTLMVASGLTQGTPADEAAIRKVAEQFPPAWAKGDAKTLAALFTADADYVSSAGLTATGRAEIEKAYVTQFAGVYKGTTVKSATTNVRSLKPDIAIANGTFEIVGMRGPDGKVAPPRRGTVTSVLVKQPNRQWLITALRANVPPPAPGQPAK